MASDGSKIEAFTAGEASPAPSSGDSTVQVDINQVAHGFAVGLVLYCSGVNTYARAIASGGITADITSEVVGIVSAVADADNFTLQMGGIVTGLVGLTGGTTYYLSTTLSGQLQDTEPMDNADTVKPLLIATNSSSGVWINSLGVIR
jgi:hypothetical protein